MIIILVTQKTNIPKIQLIINNPQKTYSNEKFILNIKYQRTIDGKITILTTVNKKTIFGFLIPCINALLMKKIGYIE